MDVNTHLDRIKDLPEYERGPNKEYATSLIKLGAHSKVTILEILVNVKTDLNRHYLYHHMSLQSQSMRMIWPP